jgi:hypothetical protein
VPEHQLDDPDVHADRQQTADALVSTPGKRSRVEGIEMSSTGATIWKQAPKSPKYLPVMECQE